jgi:hypothetical protein
MHQHENRGRSLASTPPRTRPKLPAHPVTFTPEYLAELEDAGAEFLVRIGDADVWIVAQRTDARRPEITYRALATLCDAAAAGFKPIKFVMKPRISPIERPAPNAESARTDSARRHANASKNSAQRELLPHSRQGQDGT